MGDPTNPPQQRQGTSYSRQAAARTSSDPTTTEDRSILGQAYDATTDAAQTYVIDPLRRNVVEPVEEAIDENIVQPFNRNVVDPINRNIVQPALREGQRWANWIVDRGWNILDTVMPDSITPAALQDMMTSRYGMRDHPIRGGRGPHKGDDIGCPTGTPLQALTNGRVIFQRNWGNEGFGRYTAVDYGNGVIGGYGHLSSFTVGMGAYLERGQQFGLSGSTGGSTGPHLHEEMYVWSARDRAFYCCKPDEVREAMASGRLRTDADKERFITETAREHWGGDRSRMISLLSNTFVQNVNQYGFTPLQPVVAAAAPAPAPLGG